MVVVDNRAMGGCLTNIKLSILPVSKKHMDKIGQVTQVNCLSIYNHLLLCILVSFLLALPKIDPLRSIFLEPATDK